MQSKFPRSFVVLLPFMAVIAMLPGCEGGAIVGKGKTRLQGDDGAAVDIVRVPLEAKKYGTVTGKIVYDGQAPARVPQDMGGNTGQCHADGANEWENFKQDWMVSGNGGVKNVVVYLQPPSGKFFDLPEDQRKPKDQVVERQPRCSFIDRVFLLFPSYYDGKEQKPTGQQFVIVNDAPFSHNYRLNVDPEVNMGGAAIMPPGAKETFTLKPQAKPISLDCNIHAWMHAYGFVLEHPYAAVTKDDGTFVIENVPLDVELQVVAWHEAAGFFGEGGNAGKKMTLTDKQVLELPKLKAK
ncbi:MAG TPA: hypothetical protein VE988_01155 [Gemmataceae bacterium]|nr:hypothetical protein [Gemmataceae bacterium]